MKIADIVREKARKAKEASRILATTETAPKNEALLLMAHKLRENISEVAQANQDDCKEAQEKGINPNLLNRLKFDRAKIESRAAALEGIAALPDPVGDTDYCNRRPGGLEVKKMRVPIGVVGMIFEARPHVVPNVGALCLKAGNAAIMRGGSEALQVISSSDREAVNTLITLDEYLDLLIPRGGVGLIDLVKKNGTVPIIKHYNGICHVYLDQSAPEGVAVKVTHNSKLLMPEVCNAAETLLIHEKAARRLLPPVAEALVKDGVTLKGCSKAKEILGWMEDATEEDWSTEYLDLIFSVKVVASLEEAVEHINTYGSHHTDVIVTDDYNAAKKFTRKVDSGVVLVNASTMFNDGEQLGMGAEVGLSTDKLHARGPVGLRDLTSYKYVVEGSGQIM